jgi:hypothetical protein
VDSWCSVEEFISSGVETSISAIKVLANEQKDNVAVKWLRLLHSIQLILESNLVLNVPFANRIPKK